MAETAATQTKNPKQKTEEYILATGRTLKCASNSSYSILKRIGSGGYGDVYSVHRDSDMQPFALKAETRMRKSTSRLNAECEVFHDISTTEPKKKAHFLEMVDKGKTADFKFIVMTMSGYSLAMITKALTPKTLPPPTIIYIATQTLAAIRDLHAIGYIHRDIKPGNFTVGLGDKAKTLFIIDFGVSRRYVEPTGQLRVPRTNLKFTGTIRYASRRSHARLELCRADDLEMWIFMIYEFFNSDNLFWRRVIGMDKICEKKQKFFTLRKIPPTKDKVEPMPLNAPVAFLNVISHIDSLTFAETPDYELILRYIHDAARKNKINLDTLQFEWQDAKVIEKLEADGEAKENNEGEADDENE